MGAGAYTGCCAKNCGAYRSYAFAECRELKHFACPKAAVSIGDYAFYNCMGLKEISIGQELKISAMGF